MNPQQAWQAALGQLQMEMSKAAFDTWVRNAELVSYENDTFSIGVSNAYARDWLDNRLSSTITRLLTGLMGLPQMVRFTVCGCPNVGAHDANRGLRPAAAAPGCSVAGPFLPGCGPTLV